MDPFSHECAILQIRTIVNGYAGYKTNLDKIQAIDEVVTRWSDNHLNSLRVHKESQHDKKEKFKLDKKEVKKFNKHLKTCRIKTCVVCKLNRSDLKRAGKQ